MVGSPAVATPSSKMHRNLAATPGGSKIREENRNLAATPGGSKIREEKIRVTVRMRPLNRKEQAMYDLVAWDCLDEQTIVFRNPNQERPAIPYTFGMYWIKLSLLCM